MAVDSRLKELIQTDRFEEAKVVHKNFAIFSIVYLSFSVVDYLYSREHFEEFLLLRFLYCIVPIGVSLGTAFAKKIKHIEMMAMFHSFVAAGIISYMIFATYGVKSPYYAGLNLVAIISLVFFNFSWKSFAAAATSIYAPYFIFGILSLENREDAVALILNGFFIIGTLIVCVLIRYFKEVYRFKNIEARFQLDNELKNRESIIRVQTDEAVRLRNLSTQFSPQIVDSIRSGKLNLESTGQQTEICAIFIDIVNSTDKVTTIDKDDVDRVLTKFLEDSIKILLKYDITIDKFLGDGILAFCNAPLQRVDYAARVVKAALEVREKTLMDNEFYERHWFGPLTLRMGIARGYVKVGFYGSKKYYQSYTAIGPVVNLASRLCSSAEPGQIIMEEDVYDIVANEFNTESLGKRMLKGFDKEAFQVYKVISSKAMTEKTAANMSECSFCGGILSLETNAQGLFVFMCRSCSTVVDMKSYLDKTKDTKKAA